MCASASGWDASTTCSSRSAGRGLLEGRGERLDEAVRQLADEPDRVGEHDLPAVLERQPAHGRVERREQPVLDQHVRAGDAVEQRRLAGVGVADERHGLDVLALALGRLRVADPGVVDEVALELADPPHDAPAVDLELGLTGAATTDARAAGDPATGLP
jgi:hypothetical protein